ncbi:DNA polymerase IV [Cellulomonas xylanilytica]|uniref:DNA polymerase IV n=1 Tax=Cellulomonas xylanilytica TaxID=233583 RepID=A0A510V145_9CELL|nr:DNA polymerase IV [Cellulomonas xylanilytica]GEK20633.1 DNA polymerase IV [Cellulomonas xylanilytica]
MSRGPRAEASGQQGEGTGGTPGRAILHVELDAFVASVELARRPQLRGRPVIVGEASRGVVVAATDEARAFGVRPEMPMATALQLCPQAVVVTPDHHAYAEVSAGFLRLLGDITVLVEHVGVGEAFLDVTGARRRWGPPTAIAELIRTRVRQQLGITCSVGIGSTKLVARLASAHARPDGVLVVPRPATRAFLRVLPVGALWCVGEKTEAALARRGITTLAELADTEVSIVQRAVGTVAGAHLVDLAWGRDPRPVTPGCRERSIGVDETFPTDVSDLTVVEEKVRELTDRCAARMRAKGLVTRTIIVQIGTSDARTLARSRTLVTPTDGGRELFLVARELMAGVDLRGLHVRLVGVRAGELSRVPTTVRRPRWDEAAEEPAGERRTAGQPVDRVRGVPSSRPVRAGASQAGGVSSRSTTTFVPADLS